MIENVVSTCLVVSDIVAETLSYVLGGRFVVFNLSVVLMVGFACFGLGVGTSLSPEVPVVALHALASIDISLTMSVDP